MKCPYGGLPGLQVVDSCQEENSGSAVWSCFQSSEPCRWFLPRGRTSGVWRPRTTLRWFLTHQVHQRGTQLIYNPYRPNPWLLSSSLRSGSLDPCAPHSRQTQQDGPSAVSASSAREHGMERTSCVLTLGAPARSSSHCFGNVWSTPPSPSASGPRPQLLSYTTACCMWSSPFLGSIHLSAITNKRWTRAFESQCAAE